MIGNFSVIVYNEHSASLMESYFCVNGFMYLIRVFKKN